MVGIKCERNVKLENHCFVTQWNNVGNDHKWKRSLEKRLIRDISREAPGWSIWIPNLLSITKVGQPDNMCLLKYGKRKQPAPPMSYFGQKVEPESDHPLRANFQSTGIKWSMKEPLHHTQADKQRTCDILQDKWPVFFQQWHWN